MNRTSTLLATAIALAFGLTAGTAAATTHDAPAVTIPSLAGAAPATPTGDDRLARRGRGRGKDDGATCDDHGTDLCATPVEDLARRGRGRGQDDGTTCDDHGTDLCARPA